MVDLIPRSPFFGDGLPLEIGSLKIAEIEPQVVYSIMAHKGQTRALSAHLKATLGFTLPKPGQSDFADDLEIIWTGRNQWFLAGQQELTLDLGPLGSVVDQSDGWAVVSLRGVGAMDVMARLCPLDLRELKPGQVARTEFSHMMSIIIARDQGYDIWVMRSFAQTALHHLKDAAKGFEAVKALRS